ncbi:aspartate/glutamate racemase family protein [Clostridium sp. ZS2-4]|uniref:aspartate/glutamate racemase family protein n=1 Tax=Clostridium sp. ZS2-4 TaxID=2987703 RepID=UPI00227D4ADD|nr:aspartate/glutamate racemase family protein [Clostridium sp. ZS2-4]MCY6355231.1 aspartate/glutamate racemase family protein [Clostridium sp. ZS2-4]
MNSIKVAVIAGTPVDTQMGVDFLISKGINAVGYPVSSSPEEQSKLQILSPFELRDIIKNMIKRIKYEKNDAIMIYCNSLSSAVDMDKLSEEEDIIIITPLTVYKKIAHNYTTIGVLTANNQSSAGIEKTVQSVNSNCNVIGMGILPVVLDIEKGISAEKIVQKFSLKNIIEFYNFIKVDVVILGCTHLPYLHNELNKYASIPILDPAELMYKIICNI